MIAIIDVSEKQKEFVYSLQKRNIKEAAGAGSLLVCLDELLQEEGLTPGELEGVVVVLGEGRFTSTRSAVILANSFAYTHKIPTATVTKEEITDEALVREKLKQNNSKYLVPRYYAEPNITTKKT